jgi:hypothetical protein
MNKIFDRYSHSPIFWAFIGFLLLVSYCLAGTLDYQDADARGEITRPH